MITSAEESPDFQAGVVIGYHRCANDLTLGAATDDVLSKWTDEIMRLYPGEYPSDWYAGALAGYRARRELYAANKSRLESTGC